MIERNDYLRLKHYLKLQSKPQIKKLCDDMELTDFERNILIATYDGECIVKIALDNYISATTYKKYFKKLLTKIDNYYKTKDILY